MTKTAVDTDGSRAEPIARRGLVIAGILLVAANLRAGITVVGPLLGEVKTDLHLPSTAVSALIGLPLLCFAVCSPVVPYIAARWGMERALGASLALLAAAIVLRSVPWGPALWIGTAGLGIAIATMNVLLPALLKRDLPHEATRLTGVYSAVQSATAAAASAVAVPLAGVTDHGWRLAFGVWAGLALIALGGFLPQLRTRATSRQDVAAAPQSHPAGQSSPWRSALGWQVTVFMGSQSLFYYTVLTWWPTIEEAHGTSAARAGLHQGIMQVFSIGGSLLATALLHRLPKDQRPAILLLVPMVAVAVVGQLTLPGAALAWNALLGTAIGGIIVIALALFTLRTGHHGSAAALSGMAQSVGYLLAAAGPTLIGALHDAAATWTVPLIALLVLLAVEFVAGILATRDRTLA
ncbi:MFS transporter [Tsukamurella soli]|uniref:2-nitroimidazole transporter n=1 Tax=Tsukamurella soli TaxID=644556 RepID=A0ABP8J350_9ACTN